METCIIDEFIDVVRQHGCKLNTSSLEEHRKNLWH